MEGLIEYFRRRAASTIVVSYSVFWAMWHWEGIYVTLFTSQEYIMSRYYMLKNEYVAKYFFGFGNIHQENFWPTFWWRIFGFVIPAILAYLYVWWLPRIIVNPAYKREINYKVDRRIIKNEAELRLNNSEREKTEAKTKATVAKIESAKKEAEMKQIKPEEKWEIEFSQASAAGATMVDALSELKNTVYAHNGWVGDDLEGRNISPDAVMFCDTNELIRFDDRNTERIELTSKGKYFLKRIQYSQEQ